MMLQYASGTRWSWAAQYAGTPELSGPDLATPGHDVPQAATSVFAFIGPDVTIPVTNLDLPALPAGWALSGNVTWSAFIDYTDHNRNDTSSTLSGSSADWGPIPIDFMGIVQGGTIHFHVQADIKNTASGATDTRKLDGTNAMRGQNPTKGAIKSRRGSLALQVIGFIESTFAQFDGSGLPVFGSPNAYGDCTFAVAVLAPPALCLIVLGCASVFHIGVARILGLNTFLWSFAATFPASCCVSTYVYTHIIAYSL
jgi:hypothetical protein